MRDLGQKRSRRSHERLRWARNAALAGTAAIIALCANAPLNAAEAPVRLVHPYRADSGLLHLAQATQPRPQAKASRSKATKQEPAAGGGSDGQLRQRVEALEEQLIDMQVVIGTFESLARGGGGSSGTTFRPTGGASEAARIDALETQIRAMTAQIEQLSQQVRALGGRVDTAPPPERRSEAAPAPRNGGFGQVTVSPQQQGRDPIGQIISATPGSYERRELPPTVANAGSAKDLYETAYGYLLQQDYGAAEAAFDEFLRRYPSDRLTADAQYWLGETLFVQRRYKPAGQAFLRVIKDFRTNPKAANSLLMLAMTLEQLGQKDCALFTELDTNHPNAPADIKSRAKVVRQRVGC